MTEGCPSPCVGYKKSKTLPFQETHKINVTLSGQLEIKTKQRDEDNHDHVLRELINFLQRRHRWQEGADPTGILVNEKQGRTQSCPMDT